MITLSVSLCYGGSGGERILLREALDRMAKIGPPGHYDPTEENERARLIVEACSPAFAASRSWAEFLGMPP